MAGTQLLNRYPIPGYEEYSPEEAAELLHQEKNRPDGPPAAVLRKHTKPFAELTPEERMFPHAVYREWKPNDLQMARLRAGARMNMSVTNPLELEQIDQYIGAYDSQNVWNQDQMTAALNDGWAKTPQDAKARAFVSHRELATDAAMSFTDDSKILSPRAMAERERIDDAQNDHTPDIPQTPIPAHQRKAGRPRKAQVTA